MHCASCASIITKRVTALHGVENATVNFATEKAQVAYDPQTVSLEEMNATISPLGYSLATNTAGDDHAHHALPAKGTDQERALDLQRAKTQFVLPITLAIFTLMLWDIVSRLLPAVPRLPLPMELFNIISLVIATPVLFWVGRPFIDGVIRFIRYRVANMDTLVGVGTLVAYCYSVIITLLPPVRELLGLPEYTYFDVTIVVIGFVTLGKYLETRSKQRTGAAIEKLLNLQAKTALVIRDGREVELPLEQVIVGDLIVVKPAGTIPVDGEVTEGASYVDESMISGEPVPVQKGIGDAVVAGTLNTTGAFTFRATKVGAETMLARIITMVETAQGSKAPIQALVDRISAVFVPAVLVISILTLVTWLTLGTFYLGFPQALTYGLLSFVGILVIACPCALGLATPTAIIVGVGKGAREGILIKDAATLEKLHRVTTVVMDKTGTITRGKPELVETRSVSDYTDQRLVTIAAALEQKSEHPIAHAIVTAAQQRSLALPVVTDFEALKGKGIRGTIDGVTYYAGSPKLLADLGLALPDALNSAVTVGATPVLLATDAQVLGLLLVADAVKPEAAEAIARLKRLKIKVVMLTGDIRATAEAIGAQVGVDRVVAEVLPEDKLTTISELQSKGEIVAMVGDGVNDAPALAQADVGIAMATGTDVAIESAGITLLHGDLSKLLKAIRLSRITMRGIQQNLFWAFIYNIVGIPVAAGILFPLWGIILNPIFAGLAMAFSSVSVVANSLRLRTKKL